ncbi:MAG: hypothetical protein LLF83_06415 [Methanobacterium sp.]|nr:hypothetical protein [Methanobacterium sp.]
MVFKNKFRIDTRLALILLFYLVLGFLLLGYYQYQINPDGVGYIQTALKYLSGDFSGAVNAYWGPLLSWILIPFLYFNQTPAYALYSAKILSIIVGFFTIIGFRQLSYRFEMEEVVRTVLLLVMVPVIFYFALSVITPDLLIVCIMVYYLYLIFNPDYPNKAAYAFLCGLLGAFAFMGKSFLFPFFVAQFLIMNLLHYLYQRDLKIKISRNLIIGFIAFLLVSGVWIGLISSKEGMLTFGTSGEYNHALVGPDSIGFPQFSQGLSGPGEINQENAVKNWSPFESWSNFQFQLNLIWNNIIQTFSIYQYFSFISLIIIICSLLLFIPSLNRFTSGEDRKTVLFTLVTILIYSGGYLPVLVEDRYLWPVYILLILLGAFLISLFFDNNLNKKSNYTNLLKGVLLVIFAISFIYMPINSLYINLNTGKDIYTLSNTLKTQYDVGGNIATDDHLIETQYLSFYLNTTCFGQSKKDISSAELQSQLDKYKINYYLVWGNSTPFLVGYTEITDGKIKNLRIYKRN